MSRCPDPLHLGTALPGQQERALEQEAGLRTSPTWPEPARIPVDSTQGAGGRTGLLQHSVPSAV